MRSAWSSRTNASRPRCAGQAPAGSWRARAARARRRATRRPSRRTRAPEASPSRAAATGSLPSAAATRPRSSARSAAPSAPSASTPCAIASTTSTITGRHATSSTSACPRSRARRARRRHARAVAAASSAGAPGISEGTRRTTRTAPSTTLTRARRRIGRGSSASERGRRRVTARQRTRAGPRGVAGEHRARGPGRALPAREHDEQQHRQREQRLDARLTTLASHAASVRASAVSRLAGNVPEARRRSGADAAALARAHGARLQRHGVREVAEIARSAADGQEAGLRDLAPERDRERGRLPEALDRLGGERPQAPCRPAGSPAGRAPACRA